MKTRFSKTTCCRYPYGIDYATLPDDIELMEELEIQHYLDCKQAAADTAALEASLMPKVPAAITLHQARAELIRAGNLSKITAAISAIADDTERALAHNDFRYCPVVLRDSPMARFAAAALEFDDAAMDSFFAAAAL